MVAKARPLVKSIYLTLGFRTASPNIGYRRGKGRRGEMCPQGTQKSHSGAAACLVAYLCAPTDDVDVDKEYQLVPINSL